MRNDRGDFVRLDRDVLVLRHLVAFDLLVPLDGLASLSVNKFAPNPVAGRSVDRVQGDPFGGRSGGVKADRDRHVGDLQKAFPACSRRQHRPREVPRAALSRQGLNPSMLDGQTLIPLRGALDRAESRNFYLVAYVHCGRRRFDVARIAPIGDSAKIVSPMNALAPARRGGGTMGKAGVPKRSAVADEDPHPEITLRQISAWSLATLAAIAVGFVLYAGARGHAAGGGGFRRRRHVGSGGAETRSAHVPRPLVALLLVAGVTLVIALVILLISPVYPNSRMACPAWSHR